MGKQEQDKSISKVLSDAAGAKQTGELSEQALAGVTGGVKVSFSINNDSMCASKSCSPLSDPLKSCIAKSC